MVFVIYLMKFSVLRLIDMKSLNSLRVNYTECQRENMREEETGSEERASVTKVSV